VSEDAAITDKPTTTPVHAAWTPEGETPPPAQAVERVDEEKVIEMLKTVFDPEIPVDIYELGLIYGVTVGPDGAVHVRMTLTAPNCPAAQELPADVEQKVRSVAGVTDAKVEIVFDPPWDRCMMSDAAKLKLGLM
jgi:FeS assembly SUF system protein